MNTIQKIDKFIKQYSAGRRLGPGLIRMPVRVTRGGTSFIRYQWKKPQDIKTEIESKTYYQLVHDYGNLDENSLAMMGRGNLNTLHDKIIEEDEKLRSLASTHATNKNDKAYAHCQSYLQLLGYLDSKISSSYARAKRA